MLLSHYPTRRCFWILVCLLLVLVSAPKPQQPLPHAEAATFKVTNLNDSGAGSLRQAILDANGSAGTDIITFDSAIAGGTITLGSQLDVADLTIDGSGVTLNGDNTTRIMGVQPGSPVILNDLNFQNGSDADGGAIENFGTLTITNSTFSGNQALSGNGGAIDNSGTLTIASSTFSGNQALSGSGGAIDNMGTQMNIASSTFSGNFAEFGGAIASISTLEITSSTFSLNVSDYGGAIENSSMLTVTDSTFSANEAFFNGGAIDNIGTQMDITSSTFGNNVATSGGGTLFHDFGTANVTSSLIADGDCGGSITISDGGNNLNFTATGCPGTVADPQLGPLQNNGGLTDTMLPALTGPAVDAYAAPCATATDQRDIVRPQGLCDIGATEQENIVDLISSAVCVNENLEVTISEGDGPFNITASAGINTPVTGVGIGTTTINGPEKWDNLTVVETTGDTQSINLGQFKCRTDERPIPILPAHRSRTTNAFPTFTWTAVSFASNYRVFVFDDKVAANRTVDIRENSGGPTSMTLSTALPDGRLFWRVRGRTNRVWGLWSERFTLFKDPAPISVNAPAPAIELNVPSSGYSAPGPAPTLPPPPNSR